MSDISETKYVYLEEDDVKAAISEYVMKTHAKTVDESTYDGDKIEGLMLLITDVVCRKATLTSIATTRYSMGGGCYEIEANINNGTIHSVTVSAYSGKNGIVEALEELTDLIKNDNNID